MSSSPPSQLRAILSTGSPFHITLSVSGARISWSLDLQATLKNLSKLTCLPTISTCHPQVPPTRSWQAMPNEIFLQVLWGLRQNLWRRNWAGLGWSTPPFNEYKGDRARCLLRDIGWSLQCLEFWQVGWSGYVFYVFHLLYLSSPSHIHCYRKHQSMATQVEKAVSSTAQYKAAFGWTQYYLWPVHSQALGEDICQLLQWNYISQHLPGYGWPCIYPPLFILVLLFILQTQTLPPSSFFFPERMTGSPSPLMLKLISLRASSIPTGLELEAQHSKLLGAISGFKYTSAVSKIADWQTKLNSLTCGITQWRKV